LDTQHLKTFTVTSDEMCCHDPLWLNHFLVYELTWIHEEHSKFSPQMVWERFSLEWSGSTLICKFKTTPYVNLSTKFKGKNLILHSSK
jgi:hypothetical protein